ncbi:MAG: double-strand break repair helicase AddA [Pseudomonadota bacterium]
MNEASKAQINAANPTVSTWLTANAGSGKTRVLTDRVARLLLNDVRPESILCLTYTKAAASEMQNRLFKTLGAWAMLPEKDLRTALEALGEIPQGDLGRARTLFASAIEAPGGLKIQTIHSFCSKILRQFPLEAGVNPQFKEMDDITRTDLVRSVLDDIAQATPDVLENIHTIYSGQNLNDLARDVATNAPYFDLNGERTTVFTAFGLKPSDSIAELVQTAVSKSDIQFLKSLIPTFRTLGSSTDQNLSEMLEQLEEGPTLYNLRLLEDCLLTKEKTNPPFTVKMTPPTKKVKDDATFAPLFPQFLAIAERVEAARHRRIALEAAEHAITLQEFAQSFLPRYERAKATSGTLDFDDLIRKTKALLTSQSLSWVLYRLDSRIDHILVDEAQDTSPDQWDIIGALAEELAAGETDKQRTLFVVGDKKQSIYSFQGADAAGFDAREEGFRKQLESGPGLAKGSLLYSFRSSPAILSVVDAAFAQPNSSDDIRGHLAFHDVMPGRVDLWPLVPAAEKADGLPWYDASLRVVDTDTSHKLAEAVADHAFDLIKKGSIQDKNGNWRRISAGDIMILVQRRSALFDKIIAVCKSKEIPIAGADRLRVGSELAVRDVLALLSFLALPEDDLSLAAALRSPLFGWSEGDLFDLAANRPSGHYLWQTLRGMTAAHPKTVEALTQLRDRVDFDRPYELIHTLLTTFHGRQKLLQRLGPEAEDGIDELMNQALGYEATAVPTLTGFLARTRAAEVDVKREMEAGGDLLRVMTVHGAKGLESPIVILPDTVQAPNSTRQRIIRGPGDVPILTSGKEKSTPEMRASYEALKAAETAERDRLLYVAMTRAEKWLIVCGAESAHQGSSRINWYQKVQNAMDQFPTVPLVTAFGEGVRYKISDWKDSVEAGSQPAEPAPGIPDLGPANHIAPVFPKSPSELGGEKVIDSDGSLQSGGALKGRRMHRLLEHLPRSKDPQALAVSLLTVGPDAATTEETLSLLAEAEAIIGKNPELFGPDSLAEVDIAGFSRTLDERVAGTVDRLVVQSERVLVVDFKTNAVVPEIATDTPEAILRQMGAYLEVIEAIYPNRLVEVAVLWTATGTLMPLGHGIVRDALSRATTS